MDLEDAPVSAPGADPQKPAPQSGDPAGGKSKEKDDVADLRAEIARLQKTNGELSASERYWAERAASGKKDGEGDEPEPPAKPPKGDDDDEDLNDPAKFVDALSRLGPKAIGKWLKTQGLVTKAEAEEIAAKTSKQAVAIARRSMEQNAELVGSFPELNDETSELFKETQKIYATACKRDPSLKSSNVALMQAAELASLKIKAKGGGKKGADDDVDDDKESERTERIRRQQGDRSRRRDSSFDGADDDSLTGTQRDIASRLGLSEDAYRDERKKLRAR